jgi:hypothetical protein
MRRRWFLAVLMLLALALGGCRLHPSKSDTCVGEPGEAGGGVSTCTRPPPTQFGQLGQ